MSAIVGYGGAVLLPVGAAAALTNAATTASTDRTVYTITDTTKRAIVRSVSVTVETSPDGTTWSPASGYTVRHAVGQVVFTAARPVGTQIRVSGQYQPMVTSGQFQEWGLDPAVELKDATVLGDSWQRVKPVLRSASAKLSGFWADRYWLDQMVADADVVLWLDVDATARKRYAGYFKTNKGGVGVKVEDLISEAVDLVTDGELYYVEG